MFGRLYMPAVLIENVEHTDAYMYARIRVRVTERHGRVAQALPVERLDGIRDDKY